MKAAAGMDGMMQCDIGMHLPLLQVMMTVTARFCTPPSGQDHLPPATGKEEPILKEKRVMLPAAGCALLHACCSCLPTYPSLTPPLPLPTTTHVP